MHIIELSSSVPCTCVIVEKLLATVCHGKIAVWAKASPARKKLRGFIQARTKEILTRFLIGRASRRLLPYIKYVFRSASMYSRSLPSVPSCTHKYLRACQHRRFSLFPGHNRSVRSTTNTKSPRNSVDSLTKATDPIWQGRPS